MKTPFKQLIAGCTSMALALAPLAAQARSADGLRDLVGARAAGAESDLQSRGWVLTDGHKGGSSAYTYWWHSSRKDCVMVTTREGRYAAISDVTPADCNQHKSGNGAGAAIGAVAAIAAIAAIASHKSGHHENGSHYADNQHEAEYERGYSDGLHNNPYHNYSRSEQYSSGYQNGVEQRRQNSEHREDHRWGAGYAASVKVTDLNGARAAGAESTLQSRGFRSVDSFMSGSDGRGSVWWNGTTRQCVQMIVADGHVDSISDIGRHPRCR